MDFDEINLDFQGKQSKQQNDGIEFGNYEKLQQLQNKFNSYLHHHRHNSSLSDPAQNYKSKTFSLRNQKLKQQEKQQAMIKMYQKQQSKYIHKHKQSQKFNKQQKQQSYQQKPKKSDFKLFNVHKNKPAQKQESKQVNTNFRQVKKIQLQRYKKVQSEDQKLSSSLFINNHEQSFSQSRKKSSSLFQMANELTQIQNLMKQHLKQKQFKAQQLIRQIQIEKMEKVHLFQINQRLEQELTKLQSQDFNKNNKLKFITNDQQLNKKLVQNQMQYESIKKCYQKMKKQNNQLKKQEKTLKQTLKMAVDNRKTWMMIDKQKCQQKLKSQSMNKINKANYQNQQFKRQNASVLEQQQLLRKLADEFSKLKVLVDKKTKAKSKKKKY